MMCSYSMKQKEWISLSPLSASMLLFCSLSGLMLFPAHNPFPKWANWIFMRLQFPSQVCLIPWYSILCVLFANVPCAITHFLLMPIKMVITGLIICREAALASKVAQQRLAVNNRSQFEAMFDQSKQFRLRWMINGSKILEINLHNSLLKK